MILPNVRASFGRNEAAFVIWLLARADENARAHLESRLQTQGFDAILDDPLTLNALLSIRGFTDAPPRLVFYTLVRHALLESGVEDRVVADYVAALLLEFGMADRANRLEAHDAERFEYLVDLVQALERADERRAFQLHAHLGNFALWLSGLFPDFINARVARRGAPGLDYYEELGASGYERAADSRVATRHGLDGLFRTCAYGFPTLRIALNRVSDRYFFPRRGDGALRILRQIEDDFNHPSRGN